MPTGHFFPAWPGLACTKCLSIFLSLIHETLSVQLRGHPPFPTQKFSIFLVFFFCDKKLEKPKKINFS
jgi:hypothetical protein